VTRLRAREESNRGSISGGSKVFFSSPNLPDRLLAPSSVLCNGYRNIPNGEDKNEWNCTSTYAFIAYIEIDLFPNISA
jgi:hypothetical protein